LFQDSEDLKNICWLTNFKTKLILAVSIWRLVSFNSHSDHRIWRNDYWF